MAKDDYTNNTATQGKLTIPTYGSTAITSYFDNPGDHDWFAISLIAGKHYIFSAGFANLVVRNASGVKQILGNETHFMPDKSGNYYLDISARDPESTRYTLEATEVKDDYGDYKEVAHHINLLSNQKTIINGNVNFNSDQDWFKLDGLVGKSYKINFYLIDQTGRHTSNDLVFAYTANDSNFGAYENDNNFVVTPTATGPIYVEVGVYSRTHYVLEITQQDNNDDYGNTLQTAEPLALANATPTTIQGHIENKGDHDFFKVSLLAGHTYSFSNQSSLSGDLTLSPSLSLYNATGDIAVSGASQYFQYTPSQSGDYYIAVAAINGKQTGDYPLTINLESDDYPAQPSNLKPIVVGNAARFDVERTNANDHDWLPLKLEAGKSYAISGLYQLLSKDTSGPRYYFVYTADYSETVLALRDSKGHLLPHVKSYGNDFTFTSPTTGVYYLDVSARGGEQYPFANTVIKAYQDDYADNTSSAGKLASPTVKGISMQGKIELVGDHDWFKVTLQANKHYILSVNPDGNTKQALTAPVLHLYDTAGHSLSSATTRQISFTPSQSSDFYLDVTGSTNRVSVYSESQDKPPAASNFQGNYRVTVAQDNDDFGNSLKAANPVNATTLSGNTMAIQGHIDKRGDHDWTAVKLLVGTTYNFKLAGTVVAESGSKLETVALALYNSKGVLIDKDSDTGHYSAFSFTPEKSGTYYLDIASTEQQTGGYNLTVGSLNDDRSGHISTATPLKPTEGNRLAIGGVSNFSNDHDWFPITLTKGASVEYHSLGQPIRAFYSPTLAIRDSAGKLLIKPQESGAFTASKTGRYYVDIGAESNQGNIFITKFYYVGVFFYPADDYAGNATTKGVLDFSGGTFHTVNGQLAGSADTDWFRVTAQAGQRYTFSINWSAEDALSVVDAAGKLLKGVVYADDAMSFVAPLSRDYYVKVADSVDLPYQLTSQQGIPFGTAHNDVLEGGVGNNLLYSLAGNDHLNGKAGDDVLKGGEGKDVMTGGTGSDSYYVDNKGDVVKEATGNPKDIDTVYSTISYSLPANVENLVLVDQSQEGLTFRGNGLDNKIIAGNGSHIMGGSGNDTLVGDGHLEGGAGKDRYEITDSFVGVTSHVEIANGDSLPDNFDVIRHFSMSESFPTHLDLNSSHIATDVTRNGKDVSIIHSHQISQGLIHFDDVNTYSVDLKLSAKNVADAIKYVQANITHTGDTVAFVVGHDTYVFQDGGTSDTLVELVGVTAHSIHNYAVNGSILLV